MKIQMWPMEVINVHALCSNDQVWHELALTQRWCNTCNDAGVGFNIVTRCNTKFIFSQMVHSVSDLRIS